MEYLRVSLFWYIFVIFAASSDSSSELDVFEAITANYNKYVRPVKNSSEPVVVSIELVYFNLLYMDQKQETITYHTTLEMIWKDENLQWNESEFGGTSSILIPSYLLWKPDITVTSGLSVDYITAEEQRSVSVQSDGTVMSTSFCLITNQCILSIEAFPFDVQKCNITLESLMYTTEQIDLVVGKRRRNMNATIDDGWFWGNAEWTLVSFDKIVEPFYASNKRQWFVVTYFVELRRQPIYYICVLLIPTFVTATICLLGLFVPAMNTGERVEKVNMGMATLLSMAVILGIVAGDMPKAITLPLLGIYVLAELILCTIGVIVSMLIMVAHQRATTRALIPPRWLNTVLFLKMKTIQKPERTDATPVYPQGAIRPLSKETINSYIFVKQHNQVMKKVEKYIDDNKFAEYILLQWIIIFDRIDVFFLVVFNAVNVLMSIILFK
uniref:Neurotransmitter-gated ion-channel ligand-binding domain-containing protein n=1 Tax=Plectus sambesii TaxID=2011161 RepID=A0A914WQI2_9BILA